MIVGQGPWGSALHKLWQSKFESAQFLHSQSNSTQWSAVFNSATVAVLACPFRALPSIVAQLKDRPIALVINASKGIDPKSLSPFSSFAPKSLACPILSLSGPTFAAEILQHKPAAAVMASRNFDLAKHWAHKLSSPDLRLYASEDPQGVEACGALKNVLAIACGLSDGLKLGQNARAALLTRGLRELQILSTFLGGQATTAFGLAGIGDLWLTATGDLSRNRQVGLRLAKGMTVEEAQQDIGSTCEGPFTLLHVMKLAKKFKLDLPITKEVFSICYRGKEPRQSLHDLMTRAPRREETIVSPKRRK